MKIDKKAVAAAMLFSAAMTFNACENQNGDVYGPPSNLEYDNVENNDNEITHITVNDDEAQNESENDNGDEEQ